jgi:hypothetical protein
MQDSVHGNLNEWLLPRYFSMADMSHLLGFICIGTPQLLLCRLKDADLIGAPTLGAVSFPVQELVEGKVFDGWFDLLDLANKPLKGCAIHATLSFRQGPFPASDMYLAAEHTALLICRRPSVVYRTADWTPSCLAIEM